MSSRVRRQRTVTETLGSIVMASELVVVFLASLVAFGLGALTAPVALGGGGALCLLMALTTGLLRYRWGIVLGWVVQGSIVATGILLPMMFLVGSIFAAMWVYCMFKGAAIDRQKNLAHDVGE
ncbi:DUF4233 domain-containing protein [Okibacterium endophyticum]